jgi:hypothetical protein
VSGAQVLERLNARHAFHAVIEENYLRQKFSDDREGTLAAVGFRDDVSASR